MLWLAAILNTFAEHKQDFACQFFWFQAQKDLRVRNHYWKFVHPYHLLPMIAAEDFSCGFCAAASSARAAFSAVVCAKRSRFSLALSLNCIRRLAISLMEWPRCAP